MGPRHSLPEPPGTHPGSVVERRDDLESGRVDVRGRPGHLRRGVVGDLVTAVGDGQPRAHPVDVAAPDAIRGSDHRRGRTGHGSRIDRTDIGDGHIVDIQTNQTKKKPGELEW